MKTKVREISALLAAAMLLAPTQLSAQVPLYGRFEASFKAAGEFDPAFENQNVRFSGPSSAVEAPWFYDGDGVWKVRFLPSEEGRWTYRTPDDVDDAGLRSRSGEFEVAAKFSMRRRQAPLRVAASGAYLETVQGAPWLWLGDTAWNGALLSREDDWNAYLADRKQKGFSLIQFVVAAPWRTAPTNREGMVAYSGREPINIHPEFFRRIDDRIDAVNAAGMVAMPVLLWALGDQNESPGQLPPEQAIRLANYMRARYGANVVVWCLGGDDNYTRREAYWKQVGRAVFGADRRHPVLTHPQGMQWPWAPFADEGWLDVLGYQSGHGDDAGTLAWIHSGPVAQTWKQLAGRPIINLEPPYEGHIAYQSKQPHSAYSVRRASWWSMMNAPAAGLTYGGHGIWSWQEEPGVPRAHGGSGLAQPWHVAMQMPGSYDVGVLADFFRGLDWSKLRPAQELLVGQPGGNDPAKFVSACKSLDGRTAVLYLPVGGEVAVDRDELAPGKLTATLFDPRTGERTPLRSSEKVIGPTPRTDDGNTRDWVILLQVGD